MSWQKKVFVCVCLLIQTAIVCLSARAGKNSIRDQLIMDQLWLTHLQFNASNPRFCVLKY